MGITLTNFKPDGKLLVKSLNYGAKNLQSSLNFLVLFLQLYHYSMTLFCISKFLISFRVSLYEIIPVKFIV